MAKTREEILAPYQQDLQEDYENIQKLLEIPPDERNRFQNRMIAAWKEITVWLEELVAVGGDVRLAPPPPYAVPDGTKVFLRVKDIITIYLPDGTPFKRYPISDFLSEPLRIVRGHRDVTGQYYKPYNRCWSRGKVVTKPCYNFYDLGPYYTYDLDDSVVTDAVRKLIADYSGPLDTDPNTWSEPWRQWYLDSHPEVEDKGKLEPEVKTLWQWW